MFLYSGATRTIGANTSFFMSTNVDRNLSALRTEACEGVMFMVMAPWRALISLKSHVTLERSSSSDIPP